MSGRLRERLARLRRLLRVDLTGAAILAAAYTAVAVWHFASGHAHLNWYTGLVAVNAAVWVLLLACAVRDKRKQGKEGHG